MDFPYTRVTNSIKNNNGLVTALKVMDKAITYITIIFYLYFLYFCYKWIPGDGGVLLYRSILVPGVSFVAVSLFRKAISAPRPYEVFGFVPALDKDTVGKSFPSRHVFSIFMISMTFLQSSVLMAVVISVLGICLAIIRVVGGVHFIKDVVAGASIAIIISIICYGILGGVFGLLMLPF